MQSFLSSDSYQRIYCKLNICFYSELQKLICEEALNEPSNADVICSNGNLLDSVCIFECFHGFNRVGSAISTCIETQEKAQWSHLAPICEAGN